MTIAFVQSKSAFVFGGTSLSVTLTSSVTSGNALIAACFDGGGKNLTDTVSDNVNAGNYTRDATANLNTDGDTVGVFSKLNVGAGSTTLTLHGTGLGGISAHEYSGLATSSAFDKSSTNNTTGTSATSGSTATTSQANELLFGMIGTSGGSDTVTAGTSYTLRESNTNGHVWTEDQIVSSTGAYAATFNITSGSDEYTAIIATYQAAGTGGATGSAAINEGADTVAGTGTVGVSGSAGITEGNDTVSGTGSVGVSGSAAITEGSDTVSGTGAAGAAGSAAIPEGSDAVSGSGSVGVSGAAAITESADSVSASGSVGVSGSAAITEGADTVTASGTATTGATGSAAITEGADAVSASGSVGVSGSAGILEDFDIVAAQGSVPQAPAAPPSTGGLLPGWLGEELGTGLGPYKRPGQVFGEQDPYSPSLTARPSDVSVTVAPRGRALEIVVATVIPSLEVVSSSAASELTQATGHPAVIALAIAEVIGSVLHAR